MNRDNQLLGYVRDAITEETLPGAHVYVLRNGLPYGTTTSADGSFAFDPVAGEDVIISYVGYETLMFRFDGVGRAISIALQPSTTLLDPVEIRPDPPHTKAGNMFAVLAALALGLLLLAAEDHKKAQPL